MIGRNLETQNILARLARDLGEHLTGEFTIDQMAQLAQEYGREDFAKAINDPEAVTLLDKVAQPDNQMEADRAIISKYFHQHRDMVRAFTSQLEDPLRDVAQSHFLKGFYEAAAEYARKGSDAVAGVQRMVETNKERDSVSSEMQQAKAYLIDRMEYRFGKAASATSEVQDMFKRVEAGDFSGIAETYPELKKFVSWASQTVSRGLIKQAILEKRLVSDLFSVTAAPRINKVIQDYEMQGPEEYTPSADKIPGEEEPQQTWRGKGENTAYVGEGGEQVTGSQLVHKARGFAAAAFGEAVNKLRPKMEQMVAKAVDAVSKALAGSAELSPETKSKLNAPTKVVRIDTSGIDEMFTDKNEQITSSGAKKVTTIDQADAMIQELVDSQDKVLYDYAIEEAQSVANSNQAYQAWANEIAAEINKFQGGQSWKDLPQIELAKGVSDKERGEALDPSLKPAEKAFRKRLMEMNWNPLAKVVIEKKAPPPPPAEVGESLTEIEWKKKNKKRYEDYQELRQTLVSINEDSNEIYEKMEKAQAAGNKVKYNVFNRDLNKKMQELMEAIDELDEYERDPLLFPPSQNVGLPSHRPASGKGSPKGQSSDSKGGALLWFVNTLFDADVSDLTQSRKYLELMDNGRVVVRADVLKREFHDLFVTKLTNALYNKLHTAFSGLVHEKLSVIYGDKVLTQLEEEKAAEELQNEADRLRRDEVMKERKKRNQESSEAMTPEQRKEKMIYDPQEGPVELEEEDPREEIYQRDVYDSGLGRQRGAPTEEQE